MSRNKCACDTSLYLVLQLIGGTVPFFLFERLWKNRRHLAYFVIGAAWVAIFLPFSIFILNYGISGNVLGMQKVDEVVASSLQYYPIAAVAGGIVAFTNRLLFSAILHYGRALPLSG